MRSGGAAFEACPVNLSQGIIARRDPRAKPTGAEPNTYVCLGGSLTRRAIGCRLTDPPDRRLGRPPRHGQRIARSELRYGQARPISW